MNKKQKMLLDSQVDKMGLIRAAAILAIFRTPSLDLKCLGTSFGGAIEEFFHPSGLNMAAL